MAESPSNPAKGAPSEPAGEFSTQQPKLDLKNPLFVLMGLVALAAIGVGLTADEAARPSWALGDNRIYRAEIALATFFILYAPVIVMWLAAHRLTLKSITAGPVSSDIPQAAQKVDDSGKRIDKLGEYVETISATTSEELAYHAVRLERIEKSALGRLLPGEVPPPPVPSSSSDEDAVSPPQDE